jgi:N-acylneuraminate cytidylyltransferase/CMP-N,N'-diacetyllegionaminic acid synthase
VTYTLGTICARGASRGLPGKNIRELAGHPLIAYTIAVAQRCTFVDRFIVSTDSEEIAAVARRYGAEVPFMRPAELASDSAGKVPAIQHAVREVERGRRAPVDLVVDLDPTSPLRTVDEVRACWELVQTAGTDVVFTVAPADRSPYFNMVEIVDGYARLSKALPVPVLRRQDAPAVYALNASVYAYRRAHLMDDGRVVAPRSRVVVMPTERSRDIDGPLDFAFLEFLVRERKVTLPEVKA